MERFGVFLKVSARISVGVMPVLGWDSERVLCFLFLSYMFSDPPVGCVAGQHYVSTHCEISLHLLVTLYLYPSLLV